MSKKLQRIYSWILVVGGLAGLVAMTWQAVERVNMLKNPKTPLGCNLNPIVDCGDVLSNHLSAIFGFPNAFIGIIIFAMVLLSGLWILTGNKPNRSFKRVLLGLATILVLFSIWFFSVSLYIIGKICIFCLVGWVVSVPIFVYSLFYWLGSKSSYSRVFKFLQTNHLFVVLLWYLIMLALFFARFRSYYFG